MTATYDRHKGEWSEPVLYMVDIEYDSVSVLDEERERHVVPCWDTSVNNVWNSLKERLRKQRPVLHSAHPVIPVNAKE